MPAPAAAPARAHLSPRDPMKWLIGIALVMLAAHWYFRRGLRRLERRAEPPAEPGQPPRA